MLPVKHFWGLKEVRALSDPIFEVVSQGARYWFLFLMALIVWRSYRWLARDRRQRRKRLKLLPDAGFVGELVVVRGNAELPDGFTLPVSNEGILGCQRGDDIFVPAKGVYPKHLWYSFDDEDGLCVEPYGRHTVEVDGKTYTGRRRRAFLVHGSRLTVGEAELRLRMFAGFEAAGASRALTVDEETEASAGNAAQTADGGEPPSDAVASGLQPAQGANPAQQPGMIAVTPEQLAAFQQMQWMLAWQAMQAQGASQQGAQGSGMPDVAAPVAGAAPAVLSTEHGDFAPPPKVAPGGAILGGVAAGSADTANPPAQAPTVPTEANRTRRHTRALPLPPMERTEEEPTAEPDTGDGVLPPLRMDAPTADALWSSVREDRSADDLRAHPGGDPYSEGESSIGGRATFAPRVTFYPPVQDDEAAQAGEPRETEYADPAEAGESWPYAAYPQSEAQFADGGYTYPEYVEPSAADEPYEYADEDEAPRSLYLEPDEAEQAKRVLWDRYLKGGRRR